MPEQRPDGHPGWVCDGCGKHVSGTIPVDRCSDCGGHWNEATSDRLACDRCGSEDASRVLNNSTYNRLCQPCIDWENGVDQDRVAEFGDRLAGAVKILSGEADELAARRPHPDAHLYDVEAGLRVHAADLDQWLAEEYYR